MAKTSLIETEIQIKEVKDLFQESLQHTLHLTRVSSPLFVDPTTGLNDDLNGTERKVSFCPLGIDNKLEIVQSLAKWKRNALKKYGFTENTGLYTDMNAIRMDEEVDNLHSYYVDQWDWEKVITKDMRNIETFKHNVRRVFFALQELETRLNDEYNYLENKLPKEIFFITAQELLDMYPNKEPKERERLICKEKIAVCVMQIGGKLSNNEKHDGRAADYDDWNLNGDILLYHRDLDIAFEISSMGIRVDEVSLVNQLKEANEEQKMSFKYHQMILNKELPYTIGGGIGQSRLCMYFLEKKHIGEIQVSEWPVSEVQKCAKEGIELL